MRTFKWRSLVAAACALTTAAATVLVATPASASAALRVHAQARGKFIGTALATSPLANETAYRNIAATEFNQITAENAMKWSDTEPNDNQYTFGGADQIVNFATANNQQVHGHTLIWHQQTPGWVQSLSAANMRTAINDHIATVVGRYASNPAVVSWDVVNEVFNEDGSFRQSFWYNTLGSSFIADAFRAARAADPDARLCINDYNVEGINAKSTAMYNLVSQLRSQNVPVDCVGFQAHLSTQYGFPNDLQQNMQRFANLGVQVRITELDVRIQGSRTSAKDTQQATYYSNVVNACLAVTACAGVTIWGFTDKYSWVPDTFPGEGFALIYDNNYSQKPSYTAVHNALDNGTPSDTTAPSTPGAPTASSVTSSGATLSWTASTDTGGSGLAGYNIYNSSGTQIATSTTNSVTLTGLSANTAYTVYVRARDGAGNLSANSTSVTFTTTGGSSDTTAPTTPGAPTASNITSSGATLSWTASTDSGGSGLAGYNVYNSGGTQIATSTTNSVALTGLSANTAYTVYVRARDGAGNLSANSTSVTFTTTGGSSGGCSATGTIQTQWGGGYVVQPVTVTNGTSPRTSWTVTFTLPSGHTIVGSWNATLTVSGNTVTARNAAYNGNLGSGANTTFGFQVARPSSDTSTVSGYTCA
ncbi:endo-1,4-beta-xylanase [Herbidospora cretacea]|uniref:endo-1,4-beta-xylanase n=1 Tax=Herbidospora cretacea TaxID=28444 RepID=UPI000AFEBACF|nr:endo-1,4-beta-xylanase [Herbidospora cretacea]